MEQTCAKALSSADSGSHMLDRDKHQGATLESAPYLTTPVSHLTVATSGVRSYHLELSFTRLFVLCFRDNHELIPYGTVNTELL